MPGYTKDLRNRRTQPYKGPNPIQARWRNRNDPADRQEKSHPTVGAARQWIAEQDADAERGVRVDSRLGRATIEAIARDWMEANRLRTGPKTREGYVSILNQHIVPEFGSRRVAGLDAGTIQKWVNELADRRSGKTVNNVFAVLQAILDHAVRRKYIAVNPCAAVKLPSKQRKRRIKPLPRMEVERLAFAMPEPQDTAAVLVAGLCGLRAGEVWALKKEDVLIRRLRVDEKITEAKVAERESGYTLLDNGLAIGPTKTYSDEPVVMPEIVANALAAIIDPDAPQESFIFTDSKGGPVRHGNWSKRVYQPTLKATLAVEWHHFTFHDLRHSCAAYMIDRGFHMKLVQQQMRHKSITTTMDIYGHLYPDALDAVADAFDAGYQTVTEPAKTDAVVPIR